MINIKDKSIKNKIVIIISIVALCAMLIITFVEIFTGSESEITDSGEYSETTNADLNHYLSAIEGVGRAQSLISYDREGYPMGAVVICDNLNRETEYRVKNAVHVITGIPLSSICVYSGSNN